MPCYQSTSLPSGVTTTGRTGYTTEADCLQACKEGACCEGTTCTVKPQCQCKCTSGSCCGPDTVTLSGITGPTCRGGTKAECDARGGTWRDCVGCTADAANPSVPIRPCQSTDGANVRVPVFKGVGTTCGGSAGFCCGPGTWSAKDIVWSGGFASFPSAQSFPQCRSYSSEAGAPVTTQSACEASGGMWVTTPCVSCAEVNEKTGLGGSQKFVCYPAPNPLP